MKLNNGKITVTVDETTGATTGIFRNDDVNNWILDDAGWGLIEGFETQSVSRESEKITVILSRSRPTFIKIEKYIEDDCYIEKYTLKNEDTAEYFLTKDRFGIPFPYNCLYTPGQDILNKCCISHVWCGGDSAWMYSVRCHGDVPYLVMKVTKGAIEDYSIAYDISRTTNGSFYRGAIVLHPEACIIAPGEEKCWEFRYRFSDVKPDTAPLTEPCEIRLTANKYSAQCNEPFTVLFESNASWNNLKLSCEEKEIPYIRKGNTAVAMISFDKIGERTIIAEVDGRKTNIRVQVILPVSEILQRRAEFIVKKQQYHREGSRLDGAYLIYDNETDSLYFDEVFGDHNAARERLAMGVIVCKALQAKYDEVKMQSLRKHRAFIEREVFDSETGIVYNQIARDNRFNRIFNYTWVSTYYFEWYELTGEKQCLINSARILLNLFEITSCAKDCQCMEIFRICKALEKEGLCDLRNSLKELFLRYADQIKYGKVNMENIKQILETSYVSEYPNCRICYLSQAYLLEPKEEYRQKAEDQLLKTQAFFAHQPDFHLNSINVRYWDRFWFGKRQSYGDLFPHYWSALAGWGLTWFDRAFGSEEAKKLAEHNLTGNLCVYREDGFASNNYLYPYKVVQYASKEDKPKRFLKPGTFYGKSYDAWANDQDWSLYYALLLEE